MSKKRILSIALLCVVILVTFLLNIYFNQRVAVNFRGGRDGKRISDISQVRNALELYHVKMGSYPKSFGATAEERWKNLELQIASSGVGVSAIPTASDQGRSYDYGVSLTLDHYVLRATFENRAEDVPALEERVSGSFYGIDCGGQHYCVLY